MEERDWFATVMKVLAAAFVILIGFIFYMIFAGNGMHNMNNM
ncbi:hypothetical protein [Effusibacillus pohliae]|nr:hypothetical protein [Effusibacillus pohliae]